MKFQVKSLPVDSSLSDDFVKIISGTDKNAMPPFMKLFWEEQQKYLFSSKTSVCYHPMNIRYCLGLVAKSPAVNKEICFNENTNSGFLILPSQKRLCDYKNYICPQPGFNEGVIKELRQNVSKFPK